ncbi:phage/plasmid primase, P4 family [Streptomyces sp. NPDC001876]|uniref:phage/plasmid primase, P4 family n=1 Tax=Streptomyces sp. NPDC001876 TaxID=3154402 RepID=UPI00331FB764
MEFAALLGKFVQVTEEADGGYLAVCPGHNDSRPSLRIWRGDDDKVRLTCRASCETKDVIRAVGLTWADLFDVTGEGNTVPREAPKLVSGAPVTRLRMWLDGRSLTQDAAAYAADRFGVDAETAERLGLKSTPANPTMVDDNFPDFLSSPFLRFPRLVVPLDGFDGVTRGAQGRDLSGKCPGRWLSLSNPEGQRWAPYGVFRGESGYGVIIVTEGPGDALTAVSVGYDALAIRGASLANNPELIAELAGGLRGYQVIVAGDNDDAGNAFTLRLSEGLAAHGIDVYALTVPQAGDDLTDWRAREGDTLFAAKLHRAVKAAKPVRDRAVVEAAHRKAEVVQRTGATVISSDQGADAARILGELAATYGEEADAMNAYALVAWTEGRIKHATGLGFFVWDGVTWVKSATRVRQEIHAMGAALVLAGFVKESRGFTSTSKINNLLEELRSVPSVYVDAEAFDAKPHLLSFANGVVDLRTGKLRAHDKEDMLTVSLPVDYDPEAKAPRWEAFINEIFPGNPDLVDYVRRLVGYGITGNTSEQCFAVLWGKGANGKSVFTETLTDVFGRITRTTPFATFEDKGSSGGGIPNDLAALRGSRLVMASEGESGKPMSEAVLKRVTGKDKVTARFLRQEFFTFAPTFLIMLATNHKPKFRSQDEGLWRRVKLIPFARYFAPHERDYDLDRKLRAEAAGIVAWAVRGAVEWHAQGLRDPESITAATKEYRATSDSLAGFFPGVLVEDESSMLPGADVYTAYRDWCEAEGLKPSEVWSRKALYGAMEERNVTKKKTNKGISLAGIRMADAPVTAAGPGIFAKD